MRHRDEPMIYSDSGAPCPKCELTLYQYYVHEPPYEEGGCPVVAAFCVCCHAQHVVGRTSFEVAKEVSAFHRANGPKAMIDARA